MAFWSALYGSAIGTALPSIVFHEWYLVYAVTLCVMLMGVGIPGLERRNFSSGVLTGCILGLGTGLLFILFGPIDFYG